MEIRRYEIDICDACMDLTGAMCRTPGCTFCWLSMDEVKLLLRKTNLRIEFEDGTLYHEEGALVPDVDPAEDQGECGMTEPPEHEHVIHVSPAQFERFIDELQRPPRNIPALRDLMTKHGGSHKIDDGGLEK